jgi:hypothetical protein
VEWLFWQKLKTRRAANADTIEILLWCHKIRLHSTLAHISPVQFEQNWLTNQPGQANSLARFWNKDFWGKVILHIG